MSYIGPITQNIINTLSAELNKKDTRKRISKAFNPVIDSMVSRYHGWIFLYLAIQIIIVVLLLLILYKQTK